MRGLEDLTRKVERLAVREVRGQIAMGLVSAVHGEILRGFHEQRDPYGRAWEPRKDKRGNWPLLDRQRSTSAVLALRTSASSSGVRSQIKRYMRFHQSGTRFMVARKIFPDETRGLGMWAPAIQLSIADTLKGLTA